MTTSRARLPFAGADLVILVLGWAVVTVAAAGAPRLLRPLRGIPPVLVATTGDSEPVRPDGGKGARPMRTLEAGPTPAGRHAWAGGLLLLVSVGTVLLVVGAPPALGQADYIGLPPTVPPDVYVVDTYVGTPTGPSPGPVVVVGTGIRPPVLPSQVPPGGTVAVAEAAMADAPAGEEGDRRLVTEWDLVTIGALGMTAVAAFAVVAARFRSP